jgi:integrase
VGLVNSVNRELSLLSSVFTVAMKSKEATANPCAEVNRVPGEQPRTRYLLPDEEERLMAVMTGHRAHLRKIVVLAINTGMRRGELLRLQWVHIDFHKNEIKVVQNKTDRDRFVPMNARVREELLSLRAEAAGEFVFTNRKTGRYIADVKTAFKSACRAAGLVDLHFHDLRHTFGTRAADAGVPLGAVAAVMGHADIHTTMRYAHATDEGKRRAVEAIEQIAKNRSQIGPNRQSDLAQIAVNS